MTRLLIALIAILTLTQGSQAAVTLIQHKVTQTTANQLTVAVTLAPTASGSLIVVCTGNAGTRTVLSVVDDASGGSNTYTQAASAAATQAAHQSDIWYVLSAANSGAVTVTATFSGATGTFNKEAWVFEVSGFTTAAFDGAGGVTNGTGASNTDTGAAITTTSTTGFLAGVIITANNITVNPKAGNEFTAGGDITSTSDAAASLISSTAASHQPAWTDSAAAGSFCSSTAAFKESSGSSKPPGQFPRVY